MEYAGVGEKLMFLRTPQQYPAILNFLRPGFLVSTTFVLAYRGKTLHLKFFAG